MFLFPRLRTSGLLIPQLSCVTTAIPSVETRLQVLACQLMAQNVTFTDSQGLGVGRSGSASPFCRWETRERWMVYNLPMRSGPLTGAGVLSVFYLRTFHRFFPPLILQRSVAWAWPPSPALEGSLLKTVDSVVGFHKHLMPV